jgi:hypothetical protein
VRLQRCGAVRADDPEVVEAIVVTDAVDVIEDQRQAASAPHLTLAAQLALR